MTTPLENVDSDEPTQPTLLEEDSDFAPSPVGESPRRPGPSHTASQSRLTTLDLLLVPKSCISYATWRIRGGRKRLREEGKSKREEKTTGGSLRYLQPCQLVTQMSNHRVMYSLSHRHLPLRQEQIKDTHGISTLRLPHLLLSRQPLPRKIQACISADNTTPSDTPTPVCVHVTIRNLATPHNSATFGNIAAGSQTTRLLERVPATTDENTLRSLVPYSVVLDLA
ncbi:hypothetical protein Pcinc_020205 [Petrolisthes cinctipes]|uniref:Uncharacterized protein n=1 Tax=Petrolisthes cinctipes TaxID=88211 RepID=A0AAE1FIH5_PETCI|nr:hypothetical protein Pcinc_020205 [Petrolisthes cinctipes]